MPTPVTYNRFVDKQQVFSFLLKIRDSSTQQYVDISAWQFNFILYDSNLAVVWNVQNADFTRADNYTISFSKSVAQLSSVTDGIYTITLLVTNTDMTNNQYMQGTWKFGSS